MDCRDINKFSRSSLPPRQSHHSPSLSLAPSLSFSRQSSTLPIRKGEQEGRESRGVGEMETLVPQVSHHLNDTLSPDETLIRSATRALDELSMLTAFPFSLIAIIRGEYDRGRKLAAATYLKNFISKVDSGRLQYSFANFRGEFRNQLVQTLLQAETEILRVLVDAVCCLYFLYDILFCFSVWPFWSGIMLAEGECTRIQREEMKEQKGWEGEEEASTEHDKDCTPMSKRK